MPPTDPRIYITTRLTLGHGTSVWTDDQGHVRGTARLGGADIAFDDVARVREVIAYLAVLAHDMDTEAAKTEEDGGEDDEEPVPYWPVLGLGGAR